MGEETHFHNMQNLWGTVFKKLGGSGGRYENHLSGIKLATFPPPPPPPLTGNK